MKSFAWTFFLLLTVLVGIYPFLYFIIDMKDGFLSSKSAELLQNVVWKTAFYLHIICGGIALLAGSTQFFKGLRNRFLKLHRTLGKIYIACVAVSGVAGLYIALFATGGIVSVAGFASLAILWLFTGTRAYLAIRKRDITQHQYWMIRCYALCWAAVTLRLMIPISQGVLEIEFISAYRAIAWLCWVPNLIIAELYIWKLSSSMMTSRG